MGFFVFVWLFSVVIWDAVQQFLEKWGNSGKAVGSDCGCCKTRH